MMRPLNNTPMQWLLSQLAVVCVAMLLMMPSSCDAAGASVTLRARWQGTPYLLEAAEFLADEGPRLYWQFLDTLDLQGMTDSESSNDTSSSSISGTCWSNIIDQASKLCLPQVAKILPIVVGVRQYSARLEMFRQLAKQVDPAEAHCCFVDVHGTVVTKADQLPAALKKAAAAQAKAKAKTSLQLLEADHVYNPDKQDAAGAVLAVLHAAPGSDCWSGMHEALKAAVQDAADSAPVVYAHRPVLSKACKDVDPCSSLGTEEQLVLPGYGVEAVLKNMEYSAMDDKSKADAAAAAKAAAKKAKKAAAEGGAGGELADVDLSSLGEVKGFKFDVLAQRKPHLVQELMTFRDVLMSNDEEEAIKVWDLKDAGLQAASRVAAASDPLALLAEISQNFISLVSSLTRQKVSERLRSTVRTNQQFVNAGANFMLLNGMLVEVKNFEIFSFLDRLRIELRLQGQLQALGLKPGLVQQLLKQRSVSTAELNDLRLDLSPMKQISWLNNPEKDKDYAHLPGDFTHILNMYPGRLSPMAANLFCLVIIGDPLRTETIAMAKVMATVRARQYPIRMGALLQVPAAVTRAEAQRNNAGQTVDMPVWKEMTSQEKFARAFLTLKSSLGAASAWDFWQRLADTSAQTTLLKGEAKATEKLLKTTFADAWTAAAPKAKTKKAKLAAKKTPAQVWEDLQTGSGYSSEAGMQLSDMSNYLITKGLSHLPKPMWWLNGLLKEVPEGGHTPVDQAVGYGLMVEMQALQEHIYFGRLDDEQSVVESLLEMHQSVRRWNPRVLAVGDSDDASDVQKLVLVDAVQHPGARSLTYLHSKGTEARVKPATHWVVTDLSNPRRVHAGHSTGSSRSARRRSSISSLLPGDGGGPGLVGLPIRITTINRQEGRSLALAAISYLAGDDEELEPEHSRSALILSPGSSPSVLDVAVVAAQKAFAKDAKLLLLLKALITQQAALADTAAAQMTDEQVKQLQQAVQEAEVKSPEAFKLDSEQVGEALSALANTTTLVTQELALPAKSCAVITNGRVVVVNNPKDPSSQPTALITEDFGLLQLYAESFQTGGALATYLKSFRAASKKKAKAKAEGDKPEPVMTPSNASTIVMVTASALAAQVYPDSRFGSLHAKQLTEILGSLSDWATVSVGPAVDEADLQLTAILNPLTREAQRLSQVLLLLKDVLNPSVKLYLNPQIDLTELPLKSYYRYALPEFQRDEDGRIRLPGAPAAYFPRLPQKRVLTLNLELPESWLVEPVMALHDLDNLRLADIHEQVAYAEYELDAVMLTGSCTEISPGKQLPPPKGLELQLGTDKQPHMVDTLVMQNLGYFQLKASPGLWQLSIAPGRSRELYQVVSASSGSALATGWGVRRSSGSSGAQLEAASDASTQVLMDSFTGKHLVLKVQKRAGKEAESLLPADAEAAASKGGKKKYTTINVFTVASGHMYERLQKIMILSVIKNTKAKVKFWIISNYMSPHHRRIIPAMAEKYGFDYEFVTYKWPHWLHKQTDKQRIIWAYKILFLDVLFPLDVPRMIFVDSDQVVRTDLAELYNMDLKGAPFAYTPFCDTNKETESYRFWKTGFWKQHLGDKPYHISALYLIDLVRFRQLSAGDQLRVIYENLSKDPHSLANLDQDLPNYAQHQIPIFSLPQEWLWCESWCGNSTKSKARTIDLCNNPKTKEPKLQAARRIISEWPSLDEEQANFTAGVDAQYKAQEQEFAAGAAAAAAAAAAAGGEQDVVDVTSVDSETGEGGDESSSSDHTEL